MELRRRPTTTAAATRAGNASTRPKALRATRATWRAPRAATSAAPGSWIACRGTGRKSFLAARVRRGRSRAAPRCAPPGRSARRKRAASTEAPPRARARTHLRAAPPIRAARAWRTRACARRRRSRAARTRKVTWSSTAWVSNARRRASMITPRVPGSSEGPPAWSHQSRSERQCTGKPIRTSCPIVGAWLLTPSFESS